MITSDDSPSLFQDHTEIPTAPIIIIAQLFQQYENEALSIYRCTFAFQGLHDFMLMQFRNHVIEPDIWPNSGAKPDSATGVLIFFSV